MRVTTQNGFKGEVVGTTVTQVSVEPGESLVVSPNGQTRAVVLMWDGPERGLAWEEAHD